MSLNDITGDRLVSKASSKKYMDNYDKIFRKKESLEYYRERERQEKNEARQQGKPCSSVR